MVMERGFSSPLDAFDSAERFADRWSGSLAWPMFGVGEGALGVLCVDEYQEGGTEVVRAELPGVDPDADVEVTASRGVLHIAVERHEEEPPAGRTYRRRELVHRRRLERDLALPQGARGTALVARYVDGVLEIRVPLAAEAAARPVTRVPVLTR